MDTNYSPQQLPDLDHEQLAEFAELFAGLRQLEYSDHPSDEVLRAYVANRLLDGPGAGRVGATFRDERAFQRFVQGQLTRWTRSDVSMHVLTCGVCQRRVAQLRASHWQWLGLARPRPREEPSWPRRLALGALASAAAAAIIAALWLWPASPPTSPCWIEDPCWQQVVQSSSLKGDIMVVYRASPGRF
jgi:hypothetical protein